MIVDLFVCTCYDFGSDTSAPYAFSRNRLPILLLPPVDVRAIATTVRATVASPYQKFTSRNIEPIACYLPINPVLGYIQCFDLSIAVESDSSVLLSRWPLTACSSSRQFLQLSTCQLTTSKGDKLVLVAGRPEEYCVASTYSYVLLFGPMHTLVTTVGTA